MNRGCIAIHFRLEPGSEMTAEPALEAWQWVSSQMVIWVKTSLLKGVITILKWSPHLSSLLHISVLQSILAKLKIPSIRQETHLGLKSGRNITAPNVHARKFNCLVKAVLETVLPSIIKGGRYNGSVDWQLLLSCPTGEIHQETHDW